MPVFLQSTIFCPIFRLNSIPGFASHIKFLAASFKTAFSSIIRNMLGSRMPAVGRAGRIIWIDCEMTGLDVDTKAIVEIACVVTEADLTVNKFHFFQILSFSVKRTTLKS